MKSVSSECLCFEVFFIYELCICMKLSYMYFILSITCINSIDSDVIVLAF